MFLWEHKMWVIALLPVLGASALYKYLYSRRGARALFLRAGRNSQSNKSHIILRI